MLMMIAAMLLLRAFQRLPVWTMWRRTDADVTAMTEG